MNTATLSLILIGSLIQMLQAICNRFFFYMEDGTPTIPLVPTLDMVYQYIIIFLFLCAFIVSVINMIIKNNESIFSKFLLTVISTALFLANLTYLHWFY